MEQIEIAQALERCEFFKDLDKAHLDRVVGLCQSKAYEAGECVFHQGDIGEYVYVIAEGRVALERSADLGLRKGKITLDVLGKGRVLGCWSTLLGEPHLLMCTAVCHQQTKLLAVRGSDLRDMMLADKELGFRLMERFCFLLRERIRAAYGAMEKI